MQASVKSTPQQTLSLLSEVDDPTAEIIELVEGLYGEEITIVQAFYIGKLIGKFGPSRVNLAIRDAKHKLDPIRYAHRELMRNQYGKPITVKEPDEVKYPNLDNETW